MTLRNAEARARWAWAPFFRPDEFTCSHCGELAVEPAFMDALVITRTVYQRPMLITSGYRCAEHNVRVSTTGAHGPHTTGAAADIHAYGSDAFDLISLAIRYGFQGIGIQQAGSVGGRFVHVDTLTAPFPRPRVWSYPRAA